MKKLSKIFEELTHDEYLSGIITQLIEGRYEIAKHSRQSDSYNQYVIYLKYDKGYLGISCKAETMYIGDKTYDEYGNPTPVKIKSLNMVGPILILDKDFNELNKISNGPLISVFKKYLMNDFANYLRPIITKDNAEDDAREEHDDYNRRDMDNQYQNTPDSHDWADDSGYNKDGDMDKFQKSINNKPKSRDDDDIEHYANFQ